MRTEDTSISSYHSMMADETLKFLEIEPLHGDLKKLAVRGPRAAPLFRPPREQNSDSDAPLARPAAAAQGSYLAISVKVEGIARISFRSTTSGRTVYEVRCSGGARPRASVP